MPAGIGGDGGRDGMARRLRHSASRPFTLSRTRHLIRNSNRSGRAGPSHRVAEQAWAVMRASKQPGMDFAGGVEHSTRHPTLDHAAFKLPLPSRPFTPTGRARPPAVVAAHARRRPHDGGGCGSAGGRRMDPAAHDTRVAFGGRFDRAGGNASGRARTGPETGGAPDDPDRIRWRHPAYRAGRRRTTREPGPRPGIDGPFCLARSAGHFVRRHAPRADGSPFAASRATRSGGWRHAASTGCANWARTTRARAAARAGTRARARFAHEPADVHGHPAACARGVESAIDHATGAAPRRSPPPGADRVTRPRGA